MKCCHAYLSSLIPAVFACLFSFSFAQNWQPFPGNGPQIYSFSHPNNTDQRFFAARVDSVRAEGADSAYYLYRLDRRIINQESQLDCNGDTVVFNFGPSGFVLNVDHYFGKKMLLDSQGVARFVSTMGDTFHLHLYAAPGDTWAWHPGVTATASNPYLDTILGVPDSTKDFQLSNGKTIRLSKAHGFVEVFSFLPMAGNNHSGFTADYILWGLPGMGLGNDLPHYSEIFDFEAGDVFCTASSSDNMWGNNGYGYGQRTIVSRRACPEPAYVNMRESVYVYPFGNQVYTPPYSQTDSCVIPLNRYNLLNLLPYEHNQTFDTGSSWTVMMQDGYSYFSHNSQRISSFFHSIPGQPSCDNTLIPFESGERAEYVGGLGHFRNFVWYDGHYTETVNLYAYRTSTDSLGTCIYLATGTSPSLVETYTLSPNPCRDRLQLTMNGHGIQVPLEITISDMHGRGLQRHRIANPQGEIELNVNALPTGMYVINIASSTQLERIKFWVQR